MRPNTNPRKSSIPNKKPSSVRLEGPPETDRRIRKTKLALSQALIDLIMDKGYDAITVEDILRRADVGRATFYAHYENKDQLLLDGPNHLSGPIFPDFSSKSGNPKSPTPAQDSSPFSLLPLFLHVAAHRALGQAMLGPKGPRFFIEHLHDRLRHVLEATYRKGWGRGKEDQLWLTAKSHAAAAAVISLMSFWVRQKNPFNPETVALEAEACAKRLMRI